LNSFILNTVIKEFFFNRRRTVLSERLQEVYLKPANGHSQSWGTLQIYVECIREMSKSWYLIGLTVALYWQEEDIANGNAMTSDRFKDLVYDFWVSADPERYQFYTLMSLINVYMTVYILIVKENTYAVHSILSQLMNWRRRSKPKIEHNIYFWLL